MKSEEELNRVMDQFGTSIYRMGCFVLGNEQDAQDVLQETLIRYLRKSPEFDTPEQERAWLYRVANNLCRDMLRFRRRTRYVNLEALDGEEAENGLGVPDCAEQKQLGALINGLEERYKRVLFLHYYAGYSVKEIAGILKISEAAAKKRLERGRKRLREIL